MTQNKIHANISRILVKFYVHRLPQNNVFETQFLIVSCLNLLKLINGLNKISKKLIASKNK